MGTNAPTINQRRAELIATLLSALVPTIDMWWAVILNEAKRNEESLTSVADSKDIPRCARNDRFGLISMP